MCCYLQLGDLHPDLLDEKGLEGLEGLYLLLVYEGHDHWLITVSERERRYTIRKRSAFVRHLCYY